MIFIDLDAFEGETTWELIDPNNNIIDSGGPFNNGDDEIIENIPVNVSGIYTFRLLDSFGDGLISTGGSNENGRALYRLSVDGTVFFTSELNPNFGDEISRDIPVALNNNIFACLTSDPALDDDNDGIINFRDADYATANGSSLNSNGVVTSLDTDGDGLIDSLDTNSDNDLCVDAIEANHTDPDRDGVLGNSPVTVDNTTGQVVGQGGYTGTNSEVTTSDGTGHRVMDFS